MGYRYSAVHNMIVRDEREVADDDAFDERGILKDGRRIRVPVIMGDSADDVQRAIAGAREGVELVDRQQMQDFAKAELSARWKGGLADGDRVRIGDKTMVVSGRNPANGRIVLADASVADADAIRAAAYDAYETDITSAWMRDRDVEAGDSCTTPDGKRGRWCEENGRMVCRPLRSGPDESEIAGPLSDAEAVKVKDQAYAEYESDLQNAWRR